MVEAAFLVASHAGGKVVLHAVGFEGSQQMATIDRDGATVLAAHPSLPIVYVATSNDGGSVTSVDLSSGDSSEVTGVGLGPCFLLLVDDDGGDGEPTVLVSANYGDGTVSAIELTDGHAARAASRVVFPFEARPGMDPGRQDASHPHWVGTNGGDLLVADLGNDVIHEMVLRDGKLRNRGIYRSMPGGSGPRHMCRDATGDLWVSLELSNGAARLGPDAVAVAASSNRWVPDGVERNHVGDITFEPEAGVIVTANRELNTLGVFARAREGIEPVAEIDCGGRWPTQFAQQDGVLAVANRDSDTLSFFDVGPGWWENAPETADIERPVAIIAAPLWTETL